MRQKDLIKATGIAQGNIGRVMKQIEKGDIVRPNIRKIIQAHKGKIEEFEAYVKNLIKEGE